MRHWLGRQLLRVGAVSRKLRLLPVAELIFHIAARARPTPAWRIQLGLVQEARGHWDRAEATYARVIDSTSESTDARHLGIAHYRRARLQARRKDWPAAEASFAEALRLRPTVAAWHAHRAQARERRQDWSGAAESYREAIALEPDKPEWSTQLVRCYVRAGMLPEAVTAGTAALASAPGHVPLLKLVAEAREAIGDWAGAAELLRDLMARDRPTYALQSQLARCLENLYRVPFRLTGEGTVAAGPADQAATAAAALQEAVETLRQMAAHPSSSVLDLVRLGILYERSGRLKEAAETYRLGMERLPRVDSWWCHKTAYDLEFRLDYVEEQLSPADPPRWHLRRSVRPAEQATTPVERPAGFFDALVGRDGLQFSGFLLPTNSTTFVEIRLDDVLLKRIRTDQSAWRPTFRFDVSKGTLGGFPPQCTVSVHADGVPLVTCGGAPAVEVHVARGTGKIIEQLRSGRALTKKGHWPLAGKQLEERRRRYLDVYERTRDLLDGTGRKLFLSYGTLLGCHREGGFIAGDDDFDASYVSTAPDPARYRKECYDVAYRLLESGLDIAFAINGRMLKVGVDGVWIDVGPLWFHRGKALSFVVHDVDRSAVEPVQTVTFCGRSVYVPRDPDAFLADTYGHDWRTPRQDFRYYRSKEDNKLLSQMWARPSEVRAFAAKAAALRKRRETVGRFFGIGYPAYPGFSWLISPDGHERAAPGR